MISKNRIHVHLGGSETPHSHDVNEAQTVGALIELLLSRGVLADAKAEDIFVFEEDSDKELALSFVFLPEHHGKRFHVHRCRDIKVTFIAVDEKKHETFKPGATIGRLLKWAKAHFPTDKTQTYELRLDSQGEPLPLANHLGSYVKHPPCEITLYFAASCKFQG